MDGLVKKITIYKDYKCLIIQEIRMYYSNWIDKLYLWIRYPYEYKLVEYYHPLEKFNYWKKMISIDGQEWIIYFYHHRNNETNKDGLIYRWEIIGSKTIEKYKWREDWLIYRSVEFEKKPEDDEENKEKNLNLQLF